MRKIFAATLAFISISCSAQVELPVLKTNSEILSIREGNVIYPDVWSTSPKVELDEFITKKVSGKKDISFYSSIDTLTFTVEPNKTYDFIILLDNKKAYTRINTDTTKEASIEEMKILEYRHNKLENRKDTIPFSIGNDNRIYIKGKINDSDTLNFIFDTGANAFAITSSLIGNKVEMEKDGTTLNKGSDGTSLKQTSSNNILEIGDIIWDNVTFTSIDYQGYSFDGVIGWIAFGGEIVEIDYENKIMVIHQSLKKIPKGYSKVPTAMIGGIPYINGTISIDKREYSGWFEYDTGASGSFYLSQQYVINKKMNYKDMEMIGTSGSSGSKGVKFKRNIFKLPKLEFGEFEIYRIPIAIAEKDPEDVAFDILGNDLLKRFNAIIDFKNYEIYLKPNDLLHSTYRK